MAMLGVHRSKESAKCCFILLNLMILTVVAHSIPLVSNEDSQQLEVGDARVPRAKQSSYIRFGKRESLENENEFAGLLENFDQRETQKRAEKSSFIRFGKRAPITRGMTYSDCVAFTISKATSRDDLLNKLIRYGCVQRRPGFGSIRPSSYVKKDSFVRFGREWTFVKDMN